ncbi:MAG: acylneuraminate cytidylyltransferase family protein [Phycisphaeraceae bacterium]
MLMNTLTVILARAGSKGLPGKNAMLLAGRPMLAWTLEHAMNSSRAGRVVLSTDSPNLAKVAEEAGAAVVIRPAELADDYATVDSAARHAVQVMERRHKTTFDPIVILYGNVPVRPPDLTDRAIDKLAKTGCDSVQSVYPVEKMHPYWMKRLGGESGDELLMYEPNEVYRRQDLPPVYMLNGGVIAVTRKNLFIEDATHPHAFLGKDRRAIVTAPDEVIDIDSRLDLLIAEAILAERSQGSVV